MDMIPPIWLCVRRCIHTKKPMSSATGNSSGSHAAQKLVSGVLNLTSTLCSANNGRSASDGPGGDGTPVVVNFSPSANSPLMWPFSLFHSMLLTLLCCTCSTNCEYCRSGPVDPPPNVVSKNAAAATPTRTHSVQRGMLDIAPPPTRPPPPEPRESRGGGGGGGGVCGLIVPPC